VSKEVQKRDAVFYAHVKPVNKEYLENLASEEEMTLSAYFDALIDYLRLQTDVGHKSPVSKRS
jgi:hypothetical protein